ncbi:MAG TPA: pilus assembly protein [Microthrixaceae bacterium]|nr:pilus assembly protein [Microthrixaceae bacterium]HNI35810.1 pilus assembly protein [Microthrixaceae bacterium]
MRTLRQPPIPSRPQRRRRNDRGAVLVELAMVVPILVLLVMGIVDYGVLFNQKIGLRGGVREAAWNGSRGLFGAPVDSGCNLTFTGAPPDDPTQRVMCMVKRRSGLAPSEVRVMVRFVDFNNSASAGTYATGRGLMVCAMRKANSTTHFFSSLFSTSYQVSRLSTVIVSIPPGGSMTGGQETPFAGRVGGWSFCDPAQAPPV